MLVEQLVDRAAERQLEQAGEPIGRERGVLNRDRAAVRQPDPDQAHDERTGLEAELSRRRLVSSLEARF